MKNKSQRFVEAIFLWLFFVCGLFCFVFLIPDFSVNLEFISLDRLDGH